MLRFCSSRREEGEEGPRCANPAKFIRESLIAPALTSLDMGLKIRVSAVQFPR